MLPHPIYLPRLSASFYEAAYSRDCDAIAAYAVVEETRLAKADAILALGFKDVRPESQLLPLIVSRAFELYTRKFAPLIIASGGVKVPLFGGDSEAAIIKRMLVARGVPPEAIICEEKSTNTQENILFSKDTAKDIDIQNLISIGHAVNGRRILMTIAQNWPEVSLPMCSNVWFAGFHSQNWMYHADYFREGMQQFDRLAYYASLGFIAEVDIASLNKQILETRNAYEPH